MNYFKTKIKYLTLCCLATAGIFLASCKDNEEPEIRKPIAENLIGKWTISTSLVQKNGEWIEDGISEGVQDIVEFRADGTTHNIRTGVNKQTAMIVHQWSVDEEARVLKMAGVDTPIFRLTADEFGFSHEQQVYDPETGEQKNGSYRWIYRRMDTAEKHPAEKFLGKWIFLKSYEKKNNEWVETTYGLPDEGWHEYRENGTVKFHSLKDGKEQDSEMYWSVNCATGEMRYIMEWGDTDFSTIRVSLEENDTLNVFYSQNYDPATGEVREGEFKDVLTRDREFTPSL